ncbi:IbrB-like domain-containing protein [Pannonibacter tanglangensis]|uniref:ParB N-terminal domain-containing protein n=1 Tax=Pannonibacter tanglangensis TaxID=2750084 RepID=A0ABW9ZI04_9HYPH|nr:ParB/RepB/Spo0J family partition protein [Pannonibacter sp. XCT-34]NBN62759.1 ParB N-terminal domain-containing protein [Pannonibacter sp. XCT-34]
MKDLFSEAPDASVVAKTEELVELVRAIKTPEARVEALNTIRSMLHEVSPLRDHPVDLVLWVPAESVHANDYNPNAVAGPEFKLLARSIAADGYTQPVVSWVRDDDERETVDGYHRGRVGRENAEVRRKTLGYLPVTTVNQARRGRADRMASTIRHNRARGTHSIELMSNIVADLVQSGMSDAWIAKNIGMDADELLRLKQITGIAALFANRDFSRAWEPTERAVSPETNTEILP